VLAFGALIDLSLAPLDAGWVTRLRQSLPAMPGRVIVAGDGECASVHLADERPLPFDADLPLRDGALFLAGTLRVDAQAALRAELAGDAHSRDTLSDARLIALAYRRWGDRLAEHLLGDYAFALWDRDARRVVCARDPHGNRQLFWARAGTLLAVGSSIELVRSLPGVSSALYEPAVVSLLRNGWVDDAERTVFQDVRRLPAAHTMFGGADAAFTLRRHWDFPVPAILRYRDEQQYVEHFGEVLGDVMRDRLRAPSAALYLSGGMDSTTLAVAALRSAPGVSLRAYTMIYPTLAPSEDDTLSVAVARHLGLAHEFVDLDHTRVLRHLRAPEALPSQPLDEPEFTLLRESLRPLAEFAPIAIDGEDGDWLLHAPTLLTQLRTQPLAEVIGSWSRYWWRTGRRPWAGLEWRARLARWRDGAPERAPWMRATVPPAAAAPTPPREHPLRPRNVRALSSPLWDMTYEMMSPTTTRAPILHTMPLVDPRIFAFVFALPPVPWCQNKYLFRRAMRESLPPAVLARPKTPLDGFIEARVAQWRAEGGADTAISDRVARWVDLDAVRRVLREGTPYEVIEAWRVLQVDHWLAAAEGARA